MSKIEIKSIHSGVASLDETLKIVDGQVIEYTLDEEAKAIRFECTRMPDICPALSDGKCVTSSFDSHNGDPIDFEAQVGCGKTPAGIQVIKDLLYPFISAS